MVMQSQLMAFLNANFHTMSNDKLLLIRLKKFLTIHILNHEALFFIPVIINLISYLFQ